MRVVRSLLVVLLVAVGVLAAPTNKRSTSNDGQQSNNVIQQVIKALAKRDNMNRVIDYLEKTEEDLIEKLPTVGSDGKVNQYTFLAPTSLAFSRVIPQDIANPFSYDKQLRTNVLLRHFIRRSLAKEDLEAANLTELTMADNTLFKLEHNGDEHLIDERVVIKTAESESSESVKVYIVDGVFTLGDEVSQAISRNPNPAVNPFITRPSPPTSSSLTVGDDQDEAKENSEGTIVPSTSSSETAADADVLIIADEVLASAKKITESKIINKADSGKSYKIVSHTVEKISGTSKHRLVLEIDTELTGGSAVKRSRATDLAPIATNKAESKPTVATEPNVVQQVIQVLSEHNNMKETVSYLEKSEEDLVKELPLVDSDGKANHYTFFAARTSDFIIAVPQDIANPFYYDSKLRHNVLLRHFVRHQLTKEQLEEENLTALTMADNTTLVVTHDDGKHLIDGNTVKTDKAVSTSDVLDIYVVEGVFTTTTEVEEAISRNPNPGINPFFNLEGSLPSSTDPSTTDSSLIDPETAPLTIVGGYSAIEVEDEEVQKMASFAATTILEMRKEGTLTSFKVTSASLQKLPTTWKYKMSLEIVGSESSELTCDVIVDDQQILSVNEEGKGSIAKNKILYESSCEPSKQSENAEPTNVTAEKPFIVGGYSPADVNSEQVKEMADFATATVSQALNSAQPLTVFRIVSAETQVVSGFNYKMEIELKEGDKTDSILCKIVVYDQSWTNTRRVTQCSCCGESWSSVDQKPTISITPLVLPTAQLDQEASSSNPSILPLSIGTDNEDEDKPKVEQLSFVEDYKTIDVEDDQVKKMALLAAKQVLEEKKEGAPTDVKVISASTQQLRGTLKYKMSIDIKSDAADSSAEWTCDVIVDDDDIVTVDDDGKVTTTNTQKLFESDCIKKTKSSDVLPIEGGYSVADVNDETVKEMASFATTTVSQALNSAQPLTVVRIVSAKSQVVSGINYKMEMELKEGESDLIKCEVVVYDQSWTNTRRVTQCSCCGESWKVTSVDGPVIAVLAPTLEHHLDEEAEKKPEAPKTEKLTIVGGYSDIQVDDETVNKMAAYAAKELLEMREEGELKSVTVLSAGIQKLPTTFKYKMSVEIESSSTALACDVIVDDQFISVPDDEGQVTTTNTQVLYDSACKPLLLKTKLRSEEGGDNSIKAQETASVLPDIVVLPILGGYTVIDPNEEAVKEIGYFVATTLTETLNSAEPLTVVRIVSASRQVVAGFNYDLELELKDASSKDLVKCKVTVFDQSWTKTREMSECSCCGSSTKTGSALASIVESPKTTLTLPPLSL